jgi:hypothetical protein
LIKDSLSAQTIYISLEGATVHNAKWATINISLAKLGLHVYQRANLLVFYSDEAPEIIQGLKV